MLPVVAVSSTSPWFVRLAVFAYRKLLVEPWAGIAHLVVGSVQTTGPLLCATWRAIIETIRLHLAPSDQEAVQQGLERIKVGAALLAWPLALLGGLLLMKSPLTVQALFAVSTLGLVLG